MQLNKIRFMLRKLYHDLFSSKTVYNINDDNNAKELSHYYFVFEENPEKLNRLISDFDENGVPLNRSYIDVSDSKLHYYPISIGQYALALFSQYIKKEKEDKLKHFLRISKWFLNNAIEDKKLGCYWLTDVPKPEYKVFKPWKSAFSQSRGISVLMRAWQIEKDDKYYNAASKALIPFKYDITDGGVTAQTSKGPFYEEYVASEPTMVLDGHMFSLFGLYDFFRAGKENSEEKELSKKLFNDGIDSLINWLPKYDLGYWVRFNMCKMPHYPTIDPCTIGYLRLVIQQLKVLFLITDKIELKEYADKFKRYDSVFNILRMYVTKYRALKKLNRL